jgi:predicted small lipoprotein YifL
MLRKLHGHRTMQRPRLFLTSFMIIAALMVSACGNKGSLRLPAPAKPESAKSEPANSEPAQSAPATAAPTDATP